jgi:eukaryotic-like serine/threonine-protein kinase
VIGKSIGPYQILAELGRGGMGEVYRARDAKLNRDVALKILPDLVAGDPERLARFEREAQLLASLNHPNIAAIYGVEDGGPTRALVLELVEGPTLADRLLAGALPVGEALAIARQIADALSTAHEAGIIHRDLKPANVKVRDDGTVKVLDFGLAKAMVGTDSNGGRGGGLSNSPTLTARATELGMIIGTAAYMAPEQARGKSVDRRADLWAFGVVLYEMLTGRRAFQGPEVSDVLAAVLRDTPALDVLPPDVPHSVRRLLKRTLEKDRARRLDSMAAARLDLDDPDVATESGAPAQPAVKTGRFWLGVAGAVVVSAVATGAAVWRGMQPPTPQLLRFAVMPTAEAPIAVETNHPDIAITADGSRIVYFSRLNDQSQFAVRSFHQFEPVVLRGLGENPRGISVSDDGESIVYQSGVAAGTDAALYKVPIVGGPPARLAAIGNNLRGTTWLSHSEIIFATVARSTGLLRVAANGGEPEVLTTPKAEDGEVDHLWPHALPDGHHVLFTIARNAGFDIAVLSLDTKTWKVLVKNGSSPRYSATGHIVFGVAGVLKAVPFDLRRVEITGDPVQVQSGVTMKESGAVDFALSRSGTLVYLPGQAQSVNKELVWRDPDGKEKPLAAVRADYTNMRVSPNGKFAAALVGSTSGAAEVELWLVDLDREVTSRLASRASGINSLAWSPDSRRIAYAAIADGAKKPGGMFVVSAAGTTAPERLTTAQADELQLPGAWFNGGLAMLFTATSIDRSRSDVLQYSFESRKITPVLAGPGLEVSPALSPDGRWLAYMSMETANQVFVRPFPNVDEVRIPIATEPGQVPIWGMDGRTLFYRVAGTVHSVSVTQAGGTLTFGKPVPPLGDARSVDVALPPVGKRFLIARNQTTAAPAAEYRVILNWTEELKRRGSVK